MQHWSRLLILSCPLVIFGCTIEQTHESSEIGILGESGTGIGVGSDTTGGGREIGAPTGNYPQEPIYTPEDRMGTTFGKEFDDPSTDLSKRIIYFDYDNTDVRAEDQSILMAHASYLAKNPKTSLILEGHTDERGSREYNLALGERRAQAVRQYMQLNVAPNQIEIVSYGEERPAAIGHEESAWQLNRRVEIVYRRRK